MCIRDRINYYRSVDDGPAEIVSETVSAGEYTAVIFKDGADASVTYTVAKASQTAPADSVGFVIDYDKETITANTGYELSTSNGTEATGSDSLTLTPGTDVYIRLKGDNAVSYTHLDVYKRQV